VVSERTAPALTKLDALLVAMARLPPNDRTQRLVEDVEALQRAVSAFHMEAIRFRMYSVDRDLTASADASSLRPLYEDLREALEAAGFHTRSHG
jgi:hypothetical protein